uniref:UvrD-helicase domain-containing protein n=1 Tax=uncultured Draconibacterium sp. TaxID=1573823 RepID=UPI0032167AC1
MKLTEEQLAIINSTGDIKINAVAGSGKTTTIIEYAQSRAANSRILYLAFNKSVKLEAVKKFTGKGLNNVTVETAHSLAYKQVVFRNGYRVRAYDYKTHEIVELLNLVGNGEPHSEFIIANHISKFVAYFCNSEKRKIKDLNYRNVVTDAKAREFVERNYDYIEYQTRILLQKMNSGEIEVTHDFYLKKFQLSNPKLNYDYILFDEGQDASPVMLDVFLKQKAVKVIVGDKHQQIYGWRYAINALEKTGFKSYQLSRSFRFGQAIANLAVEVLNWKNLINTPEKYTIAGVGPSGKKKSRAVLARTNHGLLIKAIEYITEKKNVKHIYFEGNINSYTYAEEGASLYDILNLYNGKRRLIKDELIGSMRDIVELENYIKKTEDVQLGMMLEIVKEYGNRIAGIIKRIKDLHVDNEEKHKAEMIFSTIHRSKGMEYDNVQLADDFITKGSLGEKLNDNSPEKLNEEINLLYVALTRAQNSLFIPEKLFPGKTPASSSQIYIMRTAKNDTNNTESRQYARRNGTANTREKSDYYKKAQAENKGAYQPWTREMDQQLSVMFVKGVNLRDMAKHFGRSKSAVGSRIKKLQLEDLYN